MKRVTFHEHTIEIRQYEFQVSTIREKKKIAIDQINEVNLNTSPPSIVINHNEVIFIEAKYQKKFLEFVKTNKLKVENRFDIWEAINEVFLEMDFTPQHQERTLTQLEVNGVSRAEVAEIREKVSDLMSGWGAIAWDRNYLGHYDLLLNKKQSYLLLFPKDFYWWTMGIALRNYTKSIDNEVVTEQPNPESALPDVADESDLPSINTKETDPESNSK
ncbi:MAG: hypothetical protein MUE85_18910 [Microscillaceae bacterium]|jgi:hypothetical protein|nr:hypothetical protein [Microscillaceae bacterium]